MKFPIGTDLITQCFDEVNLILQALLNTTYPKATYCVPTSPNAPLQHRHVENLLLSLGSFLNCLHHHG